MPARRSGWHYIAKGDYPPLKESVIVHVADMMDWVKGVVAGKDAAEISMYQQSARYLGKAIDPELDCDVWDGIPVHGAVTAWRFPPKDPDLDQQKNAVLNFQVTMTATDLRLRCLLASAFVLPMTARNKQRFDELVKKFNQRIDEATSDGLVNHGSSVSEAPVFVTEAGITFTVESRSGHGIIVQIDKPGQTSHYAWDFPVSRKIYPTEREAALALVAEAERQKWRRGH